MDFLHYRAICFRGNSSVPKGLSLSCEIQIAMIAYLISALTMGMYNEEFRSDQAAPVAGDRNSNASGPIYPSESQEENASKTDSAILQLLSRAEQQRRDAEKLLEGAARREESRSIGAEAPQTFRERQEIFQNEDRSNEESPCLLPTIVVEAELVKSSRDIIANVEAARRRTVEEELSVEALFPKKKGLVCLGFALLLVTALVVDVAFSLSLNHDHSGIFIVPTKPPITHVPTNAPVARPSGKFGGDISSIFSPPPSAARATFISIATTQFRPATILLVPDYTSVRQFPRRRVVGGPHDIRAKGDGMLALCRIPQTNRME